MQLAFFFFFEKNTNNFYKLKFILDCVAASIKNLIETLGYKDYSLIDYSHSASLSTNIYKYNKMLFIF